MEEGKEKRKKKKMTHPPDVVEVAAFHVHIHLYICAGIKKIQKEEGGGRKKEKGKKKKATHLPDVHDEYFFFFSFFFRLSRPPIGWQKRKTEKAKGPKIPKILQEREI